MLTNHRFPAVAGPNSEQQKWEEQHVGAALMSFGAKDSHARARDKKQVKEYDVIMDEEIEFVQALQMPGTIDKKVGYTQPSNILYYSI